jgi:hypothetical protein
MFAVAGQSLYNSSHVRRDGINTETKPTGYKRSV